MQATPYWIINEALVTWGPHIKNYAHPSTYPQMLTKFVAFHQLKSKNRNKSWICWEWTQIFEEFCSHVRVTDPDVLCMRSVTSLAPCQTLFSFFLSIYRPFLSLLEPQLLSACEAMHCSRWYGKETLDPKNKIETASKFVPLRVHNIQLVG
jgi:hypothetical protein